VAVTCRSAALHRPARSGGRSPGTIQSACADRITIGIPTTRSGSDSQDAADLVSGQQYHAKVIAQLTPGRVAGAPLRHEHSHNAFIAKVPETIPVLQDLAKTQPELVLFVVVRDALDLGDEYDALVLPGKIKFGSRGCLDRGSMPAARKACASSF
jgi:hypothetical protein